MLVIGFASGRIQAVPANLILVKNISVIGVVWGAQTERDPAWMSGGGGGGWADRGGGGGGGAARFAAWTRLISRNSASSDSFS